MDERAASLRLRAPDCAESCCTNSNIALGVYRQSQTRPDALALSWQGCQLTYGQLAGQAAGLARHLACSAGWPSQPSRRPRVGVLASRSADACVALLGASWAGAAYVPIGLKLPEERILAVLSASRLDGLVVDRQGARLLSENVLRAAPPSVHALGPEPPGPTGCAGVTWLDPQSVGSGEIAQPAPTRAEDAAYVIFTSGTTGLPKGVMVPAAAVRHYIQTIAALLGLGPQDRVLETSELSFDFSVHNMFSTWEAGASLHILSAARVMDAVGFAREHELTVWNSVPSLVAMLRQVRALRPGALPKVRLAVFGGEQLTRNTVEAWQAAAPASIIHNLYGPTEVTVFCLGLRVTEPLPLSPGRDVLAIGRPLPGTEAAVLNRDGSPACAGTPGELAIAGVQLADGYLNAPELTTERFVNLRGKRWYLTGDLATEDSCGVFHCLGRLDNQVKVLGHRIELEEIETHLRQVVDSAIVATVAWPVVDGAAQGLVAFVSGSAINEAETLRGLKARLPHYMVPARVHAIGHMPLNANGKVDRQALRQYLEAGMN